jgi:YfiH family protein
MSNWLESAEAIGAVDAVLAAVGLEHGRRSTRTGSWKDGERVKRAKSSRAAERGGKKAAGAPGVVGVAAWKDYRWLRAGFSTRVGGGSTAYSDGGPGELNLGWTSEDEPKIVAENRRRFVQAVAGRSKMELAAVRQFHSGMIRVIEAEHGALTKPDGKAVLRGDGLMTDVAGILLGVQTADCIPVLVADTRTHAVAAFHAGWRGTLARIVERGVGTMKLRYGSRAEDLVAAVGPGSGACCYAVGEDVRFEFESQFAYGRELFSEVYDSDPVREKYPLLFLTARAPGHSDIGPQIHVDLWEANRRQLLDAGVRSKNISVVGECTGCARDKSGVRRYFSHRMEQGYAGRMMGVIGVAG